MEFDFGCVSSAVDMFFEDTKPRVANAGKIRISNMSQLAGFALVADDTLVRVSQKDFWHIGEDEEGHFIERLVSDDTGPVQG